jgi:hypothetical protein
MNEDDFSIFKRFPHLELAEETAKILNDAGIKTIIVDIVPSMENLTLSQIASSTDCSQ